jgi:endonuclease/exonuclease/phosphatase family metal-dependent hydrolase
MTTLRALGLTIAAITLSAGCDTRGSGSEQPGAVPAVTIMTFNVENLFDNNDDAGKNDSTFLALEDKHSEEHRALCEPIERESWRKQCLEWDWNDEIIDRKLTAIAAAILQVDDGRGADVIALQEVENIGILERLRTEYLANAGYRPAILIEGDDLRGIDVAFLSRLELHGEPQLHAIDFGDVEPERIADTRGILEATFVLPDGSLLTGYSVHFPAPFHPTGMRESAYERLNELRNTLPGDRNAFAAGDFNTTAVEDRDKRMFDRFVRPGWVLAHDVGCEGCPGTSYYEPRDDWSFLDTILWSRGENTTWALRADSVRIANAAPGQTRENGTPWRFEIETGAGVSDHWPMVATIETE